MAVRFVDSFAHYGTAQIGAKYSAGSGSISAGAGRTGGPGLTGANVTKNVGVNAPTLIVGVAVRVAGAVTFDVLRLLDSGTLQVSLRLNADGSLSALLSNSTVLGTTAPGKFVFGSPFNAIGFEATIHNTAGVIKIFCNDAPGAPSLSLAAQNTRISTNNFANQVQLIGGTAAFADLWIADATGAGVTTYPGDCRVEYRAPVGDGAVSQSTPNNGTAPVAARWDGVNETAITDDANYNAFASGNRDEYTMQDLTAASGGVYAVCPIAYCRKDDAGPNTIRVGVVSGGSTAESTDVAINTAYGFVQHVAETDPNGGGAWSIASVNAASGMFRRTA